jgi:cardiolipin synthase
VLVDGIGGGYFWSGALRELGQAGIPAARFMHDWRPWRMPFLNMRNHKKLMIIDGAVGFAGGLNLGTENLRRSRETDRVSDVHFRVDGPVVSQLMLTFAEDWAFTTSERLTGDVWWPQLAAAGSAKGRGIASGPDEDTGKIEIVLAAAVASARQRLRIVTPYFLPDQRLMSGIVLAALRGVEVEVVIPARSDHRLLDWAMRSHLGFFAIPEIAIYLSAAPFDHSKLMTVDGVWSGVGSANWDVRSLRLNFEFLLETYDTRMAAEIDRLIDEKLARARKLPLHELAERPPVTRLRDAAARLLLPYL